MMFLDFVASVLLPESHALAKLPHRRLTLQGYHAFARDKAFGLVLPRSFWH